MDLYLVSKDGTKFQIDKNNAIKSDFINRALLFPGFLEAEIGEIKLEEDSQTVNVISDLINILDQTNKLEEYLKKYEIEELLTIKDKFKYLIIESDILNEVIKQKLIEEYPDLNKSYLVVFVIGSKLDQNVTYYRLKGIFNTKKEAKLFVDKLINEETLYK